MKHRQTEPYLDGQMAATGNDFLTAWIPSCLPFAPFFFLSPPSVALISCAKLSPVSGGGGSRGSNNSLGNIYLARVPKSRDAAGCEYDQGAEDAVMVSCDAEMIQFHSQMEKMKLQKKGSHHKKKKSAYPFRGEEKKMAQNDQVISRSWLTIGFCSEHSQISFDTLAFFIWKIPLRLELLTSHISQPQAFNATLCLLLC